MKRSSGFTIVELAVVIVVLAILVTVTVVSFGRVQSDARNTSSDAKGVAIAEGLERYYEANGEYPSCALVTQANTTTVTSTVLKGLDPNTLTRAGAASEPTPLTVTRQARQILPIAATQVATLLVTARKELGKS